MKVLVSSDEWYPMAYLIPETDKEFAIRVSWNMGHYMVVDATPEEVAEYKSLCDKIEEMSSMFLERDGITV